MNELESVVGHTVGFDVAASSLNVTVGAFPALCARARVVGRSVVATGTVAARIALAHVLGELASSAVEARWTRALNCLGCIVETTHAAVLALLFRVKQ